MANCLPAGEELNFDDIYDDYNFEQEPNIDDLASFHDDIPFVESKFEVKSNCFVDKSSKSPIYLLSDLQNAVISGNINTLKMLIENRPDYCNSVMDSGWTPLAYASNFGHVIIVEALLEGGADVNLVGIDGSTALMAACKCSRSEDTLLVLQKLFDKKADSQLVDKNGKTALIYAVRSGKYDVVELVLKHSLNIINHKDKRDWTALDWAIMKSFGQIILLLIKNGATVYNSNSEYISSLPNNVIESVKRLTSNSQQSAGEGCQLGSPEKRENEKSKTNSMEEFDPTQHNQSLTTHQSHAVEEDKSVPLQSVTFPQQDHSSQVEDIITIQTGISGDGYQKYVLLYHSFISLWPVGRLT